MAIQLKYSDAPGSQPSGLLPGQVAVNRTDRKLYYDDGTALRSADLTSDAEKTAVGNPIGDALAGRLSKQNNLADIGDVSVGRANLGLANVANIAALSALFPAIGAIANLTERGREGTFGWFTGDFGPSVVSDPLGGCYIKANTVSAGLGAWVRLGPWATTGVPISWFGLNFTDDTAAIQAALNFASSLATKQVLHGSQALTYSAAITLPAGVKLVGNGIGSFGQKSGANLYDQFVMGAGCEIRNVIIDGNWDGNPTVGPFAGIRIGNSSNCVVEDCTLKNFSGYPVVVNAGLRARVKRNRIFNFYNIGIIAYGSDLEAYHEFEDNFISDVGWGGLGIANSNFCKVSGNTITGLLLGKPGGRQRVNLTTGGVVTWVSGPNFSSLKKGNFLVADGGKEWRIRSVDSPTQISIDLAFGPMSALNNTPCVTGAGDLLGYVQSSFGHVFGNTLREATTFGSGYSLGQTSAGCSFNVFEDNRFINLGKNGFNITGTLYGTGGQVQNNTLRNNKFVSCGCGAGIDTPDQIAIYIQDVSSQNVISTHVSGNEVISFTGDGQTTYWLGTNGLCAPGTVTVNDNVADYGVLNGSAIFQGVKSISLDAGWGSGAAVSNIVTDGKSVSFVATSGSSGISPAPGITISKIVEGSGGSPFPVAKCTTTPGAPLLPMWGENLSARGAWRALVRDVSPAASTGYGFVFKD